MVGAEERCGLASVLRSIMKLCGEGREAGGVAQQPASPDGKGDRHTRPVREAGPHCEEKDAAEGGGPGHGDARRLDGRPALGQPHSPIPSGHGRLTRRRAPDHFRQ